MRKSRSCLIIDDDDDDQELFIMCLAKIDKNINCTTANNGVDAITMLMTGDYIPDYIFVDVNMPKMNGIDCLRILKTIDRLQYTRVFMYSTTSDKSSVGQSEQLGAEDFIIKPSSAVELKEKLSEIFKIVSEINN